MKKHRLLLSGVIPCLLVMLVFSTNQAFAGAKIMIDDEKYVTLGAGVRASAVTAEDASPDANNWSSDFDLNNIRLYTGGHFHEIIDVEFNTDIDSADDLHILDAVIKFSFDELFNVWAGRHLPPTDRSNLDGPFYLATWDFPGLTSRYPSIFAGRDDGVSINGQWNGGQMKYALGAFEGKDTSANGNDSLLYAGRFTYNFWDPEPGYYTTSTYYGDKEVLAVGIVMQAQNDGAETPAGVGRDLFAYNVEAFMEKKVEMFGNDGVLTLEAAFYNYDLDDGVGDGEAVMALIAYLFPEKFKWGQLQPHFRYQEFNTNDRRYDVGLNYVIDGHNARLSLVYSGTETATTNVASQILLGGQFQY